MVCVQAAYKVTGLVIEGLAMGVLLVKELAITEISGVLIGGVGMRLVEKLTLLLNFGDSITLILVVCFGKCFDLFKTSIMVAFLIIALGPVVFALIVKVRGSTVMGSVLKLLQVVSVSTSVIVTVVVTSDVLSIVEAISIIRVNHIVNITTIVGLCVIVTIRVLAAVMVAAASSIVVVGVVSVLSGEQVNDTIAIEEVINGVVVVAFTIKSSRSNITGCLARGEELEALGSAAGVTAIMVDLEARIIVKVIIFKLKILLILEIKLMVGVDVEVVIGEVGLDVFRFILVTGDLAFSELVLKAEVILEACHFGSDVDELDVVFRLNARYINLIGLNFDATRTLNARNLSLIEFDLKFV